MADDTPKKPTVADTAVVPVAPTPVIAASPPAAAPALLTPSQHAVKHGQTQPAREDLGDRPVTAAHLGAEVLNGWALHEFFQGAPPLLSDAAYIGAIEAAKAGKAHAPANLRATTGKPPDPDFARRYFASIAAQRAKGVSR